MSFQSNVGAVTCLHQAPVSPFYLSLVTRIAAHQFLWEVCADFAPSVIVWVWAAPFVTTLALVVGTDVTQVRSLTQLYSVDFSKWRIAVKSAFSTNAHSRFELAVLAVSWDLERGTPSCVLVTLYVLLETTHKVSRGAVSAQKALQGSKTVTRELLGGTEEKSISPTRGHWFALQANEWIFTYLAPLIFNCLQPPWLCFFQSILGASHIGINLDVLCGGWFFSTCLVVARQICRTKSSFHLLDFSLSRKSERKM